MTKAAQDLYTYKPSKATASPKWVTAFDKDLNKIDKAAADWKSSLSTAKRELDAEQKASAQDLGDYERLLRDFHSDAKDRMTKLMMMIEGLRDEKAPDTLLTQAKKYCNDLISDLADPLDYILKASASLQGNRENFPTDSDIDKAVKAGSKVPAADLKQLIKEYKAEREVQIDRSNKATNEHTNKLKTYRPRALDAQKMIAKIEAMPTAKRDDLKDDLSKQLDEAAEYFKTVIDGNFLLPANSLLDLKKVSEIHDDDSFGEAIEKSGGKNRIASYASVVTKQYNAWKVQEKKIVLLQTYCKKIDNEKLEKKLGLVVQLALKNKAQGQVFKKCLEGVVERWKKTAQGQHTV